MAGPWSCYHSSVCCGGPEELYNDFESVNQIHAYIPDLSVEDTSDSRCSSPERGGMSPRSFSPRHRRMRVKCFSEEALGQMMSPGDVLYMEGSDQMSQIGAVGGFMGHVLLVLSAPQAVPVTSMAARELAPLWPTILGVVPDRIWCVDTLESQRDTDGLKQMKLLMAVSAVNGSLLVVGGMSPEGTMEQYENEPVALWSAPLELRRNFKTDVMDEVLSEMKACEATWSYTTAAKALLVCASLRQASLPEIQECWNSSPICTSVVITFWQRYLCKIALNDEDVRQLIFRWMPIKADRALPVDLVGAMLKCQWTFTPRVIKTSTREMR